MPKGPEEFKGKRGNERRHLKDNSANCGLEQ